MKEDRLFRKLIIIIKEYIRTRKIEREYAREERERASRKE